MKFKNYDKNATPRREDGRTISSTLKTLHREAELQRRHMRWFRKLNSPAVRLFKAVRALVDQEEIDNLKRLGVVK